MAVLAPNFASLELQSPFLEGLCPAEIDIILAASTQRRFPAHTVITRQGSSADHFFLLIKGRARYFIDSPNGQRMLMMWVVPGGLIGGAAVTLKLSHYAASTEAVRDCVALCWSHARIRELVRRFPRLLDNCVSIAAEYLTWSIETLIGLTSRTAPERLGQVLVGLSRIIGQKVAGGLELDVTNEELASAANITPYTTSRLLSRWQKSGLVRKHRGKIILHSPEKLVRTVPGPTTISS